MKRSASATWEGQIKDGKGTISTESEALTATPFGFNTRFEDEPGTNPEELIGAAHSGCFAMALSSELTKLGITAKKIDVKADVHLEKQDSGFVITKSVLSGTADVGDADQADFETAVKNAKAGCPVSNALSATVSVSVERLA